MVLPDIRLIATDLDGTLLGGASELLEENTRALQEAAAAGVHIAIASGRMALSCSRIALDMGLEDCHILGSNGGHILEKPFGRTIACRAFPGSLRDRCLAVIREEQCAYNLYTGLGVYTNQQLDSEGEARFRSYFAGSGCQVVIAPDAAEHALDAPCLKLLIKQAGVPGPYVRAREAIAAFPGLCMTSSAADNTEIMLEGTGKGRAVADLADFLNIPLENVAAFGDFDNDVEMLAACGLSVAMGNAVSAARDAARFVTLHHTEAGVGYAIRALLGGRPELLEKQALPALSGQEA